MILLANMERCLSVSRLAAYRLAPAEPPLETLGRYMWNVALCEALYTSLNGLEVAFRNTLYDVSCQVHGGDGWITGSPSFLQPLQARDLTRTLAKRVSARQPVDAPHMAADMSFGFWTGLLDSRYDPALWPRHLKRAFPHILARDRTRKNIAQRFEHIRLLRNRVFHHEPIWHRNDLAVAHGRILEALEWLSPDMAAVTRAFDRFDTIHGLGQAHIVHVLAATTGGVR